MKAGLTLLIAVSLLKNTLASAISTNSSTKYSGNNVFEKRQQRYDRITVPTLASLDSFSAPISVWSMIPGGYTYSNKKGKFISSCKETTVVQVEQPSGVTTTFFMRLFSGNLQAFSFRFLGLALLAPREDGDADVQLCLKTPTSLDTAVGSILSETRINSVSFWVDLSVTRTMVRLSPVLATGEVVFGASKPNRFKAGTETSFRLQNLFDAENDPAGWITEAPVTILIEQKPGGAKRLVTFDINTQLTVLPSDMYDTVLGPKVLRSLQPVSAKLPRGPIAEISDFIGDSTNYFDCRVADSISSFKLNNLIVPGTFLFENVNGRECVLRVVPQPSKTDKDLVIGYHLIKNYHVRVEFNREQGSIVEFSQRKGGRADPTCKACCIACIN